MLAWTRYSVHSLQYRRYSRRHRTDAIMTLEQLRVLSAVKGGLAPEVRPSANRNRNWNAKAVLPQPRASSYLDDDRLRTQQINHWDDPKGKVEIAAYLRGHIAGPGGEHPIARWRAKGQLCCGRGYDVTTW